MPSEHNHICKQVGSRTRKCQKLLPKSRFTNDLTSKSSKSCICSPVPINMTGLLVAETLNKKTYTQTHMLILERLMQKQKGKHAYDKSTSISINKMMMQ